MSTRIVAVPRLCSPCDGRARTSSRAHDPGLRTSLRLAGMRLKPIKRRFPEHHIVGGADPPIVGCQQISPMLWVECRVVDSTETNPTQARQLGENGLERGPRQLRTQRHGYAVEPVVDAAAEVLRLRQIEALSALVLEPGSERKRSSAVIAADVFSLLDIAALKISAYSPLVPHAQFALQPTVENSLTVPVGLRPKDPSNA
jgi:hypothetical protein